MKPRSLRSSQSLGIAVGVACLFGVLCAGSAAWAQDPEAPPAPAAQAAAPEPLALSDVARRSEALVSELRGMDASLAEGEVEHRIQDELPSLAELVEPHLDALEDLLVTSPSLATLDDLTRRWQSTLEGLVGRENRLRSRVSELEEQLDSLDRLRDVWLRTESSAREREAPEPLLEEIARTRRTLKEVRQSVAGSRNDVLILGSQLGELRGAVQGVLDRIGGTRQRIVENILVRDQPVIWRADGWSSALGQPGGAVLDSGDEGTEEGGWLSELRDAVRDYSMQYRERVVLHAALLLVLLWVSFRLHRTVASGDEASGSDAEVREAARGVFDRPVAAALVVALLLTAWLHPQAPVIYHDLAGILMVLPLLVVLRQLLDRSLHPLVMALALFYLVDLLRRVVAPIPLYARWLYVIELGVAVAGLAWLLRSTRLDRLPDQGSQGPSGWLRALGVWARISFALLLVSLLGAVLGYTSASLLLGEATLRSAYLALVFYAGARITEGAAAEALRSGRMRRVSGIVRKHGRELTPRLRRLVRVAAALAWILATLGLFQLRAPVLDGLGLVLGTEIGYGSFSFSLADLGLFGLTLWVSWLVARGLSLLLEDEIFPRIRLPRGVPYALSTVARYSIVIVGLLVALSLVGFDLDRITILLGALGVGIGFGLQNVVNNFVSGLILLFERPIQVGDRVQVAELTGLVTRIGIRSSTVRTWQGADVVVPNASFISDRVINWTLADRTRRIDVSVGVAYGTDPERVISLLAERASAHPEVLGHPEPQVLFIGFGDSSLDFEIRIWTDNAEDWPRIRSELTVATHSVLAEAGIEIPFPQRDLHLRSVDPEVRPALSGGAGGPAE